MIQEKVTSMLSMAGLTPGFWVEAAITTVYLINRSPSVPLDNQIPEELWTRKTPHYAHLRVFGCEAYAHVPKELCAKLDPKSQKCIFIGYGLDGHFGYQLSDPKSQSITCSTDVVFNETRCINNMLKRLSIGE